MKIREKFLSIAMRMLGVLTPVEPAAPKRRGLKINNALLARLGADEQPTQTITKFALPALPAGVIPTDVTNSLAMDSAMPMNYANLAGASMDFPGYPILSELSQRSEYRSPTTTLATEMTRKWVSFKSIGDEDRSEQIKLIEQAFDTFKVRDVLKQAIEHDGYFGRGMVYIDLGKPQDNNLPLVISSATIKKDSLKGFKAIEPIWTSPADYNSIDPTDKYFYRPRSWYVMGKPIHTSRVLLFISHPVADMLKPSYNFSGLSMTQMLMPAVDNWLRTRDAISDMVHSFSVSGLKTNMATLLAGDGEEGNGDATGLLNRATLFNRMRDNRNLMMLNEDEEFFQFNTPLSGLSDLQAQAQEQMAAPCHIPLVKLFGITPNGLNASSDGEIRVFYDYVLSTQQVLLTDPLVVITLIVQLHLFGKIYPDIIFEYLPLEQMTEEQIANINKINAEAAAALIDAGVICSQEERQRLASSPLSGYNGLDAEDVPEQLDNDPAMDGGGEWSEGKHPRADNGQFGSGGSGQPSAHKGKADLTDIFDIATSRADGNKSFANIAPVSPEVTQKISAEVGVDVTGWVHGIDESAIRHILKKHGNAVTEAKRGQVAVTKTDIEKIGDIVNAPDSVEYGGINDRGNETVILKKNLGNHTVCIQELRTGNKKLSVVSMWIKKTT
ncbi:MAG: DUF1073 domain-containing protein [Moraxellaceae bacterium]|nr:MAG: DUF1073 domain-containing protein [Moraxellaceae bacterium]